MAVQPGDARRGIGRRGGAHRGDAALERARIGPAAATADEVDQRRRERALDARRGDADDLVDRQLARPGVLVDVEHARALDDAGEAEAAVGFLQRVRLQHAAARSRPIGGGAQPHQRGVKLARIAGDAEAADEVDVHHGGRRRRRCDAGSLGSAAAGVLAGT